jgi:DNA-binding response OmpR family regulator
MKSAKPTILCVDDNEDNLELLTYLFEDENFNVITCTSLEDCLSQTRQNRFSAIILDNRFGDKTSLDACKEIRSNNPNTPIIFYSGEARETEIAKALDACGNAYLVKPLDLDKLTDVASKLIQESQSA